MAARHDAPVLGVGLAVLQARSERPQLGAIQRTDERRDEVAVGEPDASGGRIERHRRRLARVGDRLALVHAEVERPALVQLPARRVQAGIREQARPELVARWLMLVCSCAPGVVRTPSRVVSASNRSPFACSHSPKNVVLGRQ